MGAGKKVSLQAHVTEQQKKAANRGGQRWAGKLKNWRDEKSMVATTGGAKMARVYVLLATHLPIVEIPIHSFPKIIVKKQDGQEQSTVFNTDFNCFEQNEIVENQFRYDDGGHRVDPPTVCPICLFNDWLRQEIEAEAISWTDLAFKFKADDKNVILHAGGMIGMFNGWDLDDDDKTVLKDAGINLRQAFRENAQAKIKFLYCVVNLADLDSELQATIESKSLGQSMTALIDERKTEHGEKGDPSEHPYPFKWKFQPGIKPADQYSVSYEPWEDIPGYSVAMKERAIAIARGTKAPPVFEQLTKWRNVKDLRISMEAACVLDGVPWDDIFAPVEALADDKGWVEDAEDKASSEKSTSFPHGEKTKKDEVVDGGDVDLCGACQGVIEPTDTKCPHCGEEFEDDDEEQSPAEIAAKVDAEAKAKDEAFNALARAASGDKPDKPADPPKQPEALAEVAGARKGKGSRKPSSMAKGGAKKEKGLAPGKPAGEVLGEDTVPWEGDD